MRLNKDNNKPRLLRRLGPGERVLATDYQYACSFPNIQHDKLVMECGHRCDNIVGRIVWRDGNLANGNYAFRKITP